MNREIKFRAWDFIDKKMINFFNPVFMKVENSINFLFSNNFYDLWYSKGQRNSMDLKTFDIMQFTGLKDKNGVEIYEGDLVNYLDRGLKVGGNPYQVIFREGEFFCKSANWEIHFRNWTSATFFEVIGNIYENPELL